MSKTKLLLLTLFITLVGFWVRAYKITESPGGLYIDEISIGYNAWSVLETGRDEHGRNWPLFFEAFGEWKLPVYIYLVTLAQLFIGPTDLSVRLPALFLGTFAIPSVIYFTRKLLANTYPTHINTIAMVAGGILAVSPGYFQFSRPGFEVVAGLFFLILGFLLFFQSLEKRSTWILQFAVISLSLSLYSYHSSRIVVPALVLYLVIAYRKSFHLRVWFLSLVIGTIMTLPFWRYAVSPAGLVRVRQISIVYNPKGNLVGNFIENYLISISPFMIYVYGDPTIADDTPHRMPLLYAIDFPFVIVGLVIALKEWLIGRKKEWGFIIWFIFIAHVPTAIATGPPHGLRQFYALPPIIIVTAVGWSWLVYKLKNKVTRYIFMTGYTILLLLSLITFLNTYHRLYAVDASRDWHVWGKRAGEKLRVLESQFDDIYIENGINVVWLWYLKMDPRWHLNNVEGRDWRNYRFVSVTESISGSGHSLLLTEQDNIYKGDFFGVITLPSGYPMFKLWRI